MCGKLIVITGPSAAGKTRLAAELIARIPNAARFITTTTRRPREGEQDGADYHFMPEDSFRRGIRAGDFVEWAEVYGNYYGGSRRVLAAMLAERDFVFAVVDVQGAFAYRRAVPRAVALFLRAPREDIERRIRALRADAPEAEVARRLAQIADELALADSFDAVVENRDGRFEETVGAALTALFARA